MPHVTHGRRTPDVIIDCDWTEAGRYLFRARPDEDAETPLVGVRVHSLAQPASEDWSATTPPLPPFDLPPFRNRFIGLHAAAVKTPQGKCLVLVGKRGSGKSTLSVKLTNEFDCEFLTDELVCIHRRTTIVEPFAMAIGLKDPSSDMGVGKILVAANDAVRSVAHTPVRATHAVFLNPLGGGDNKENYPILQPIAPNVAFHQFIEHHLDVGCNMDEAIVTLLNMAENLTIGQLDYRSFEELMQSDVLLTEFAEM